ncbi:MAG: hypothetical protein V4578_11955 [Pseudomonadota bacterium]
MLVISDGKNSGISGTFPIPYAIFPTIRFFEAGRRIRMTPVLIVLETTLLLGLSFLLISNPEPSGFTAFSIGFPSLLIGLKFAMQKKVDMQRAQIIIIGVAPTSIWVEHILLCATLALSAMWANQMQGIPLLGPSFFSVVTTLACACALWPFLNLACQRRQIADL